MNTRRSLTSPGPTAAAVAFIFAAVFASSACIVEPDVTDDDASLKRRDGGKDGSNPSPDSSLPPDGAADGSTLQDASKDARADVRDGGAPADAGAPPDGGPAADAGTLVTARGVVSKFIANDQNYVTRGDRITNKCPAGLFAATGVPPCCMERTNFDTPAFPIEIELRGMQEFVCVGPIPGRDAPPIRVCAPVASNEASLKNDDLFANLLGGGGPSIWTISRTSAFKVTLDSLRREATVAVDAFESPRAAIGCSVHEYRHARATQTVALTLAP